MTRVLISTFAELFQHEFVGSVARARGARVRAARQGGGVLPGVFAPPEEARRPRQAGCDLNEMAKNF